MRRLHAIILLTAILFIELLLAQPTVIDPFGEGPVIIGQTYGTLTKYYIHTGLDFFTNGPVGIKAVMGGYLREVRKNGVQGGDDYTIIIETPTIGTIHYTHINRKSLMSTSNSIGLIEYERGGRLYSQRNNKWIPAGEEIGTLLDLGANTHLHFEYEDANGNHRNPLPFLNSLGYDCSNYFQEPELGEDSWFSFAPADKNARVFYYGENELPILSGNIGFSFKIGLYSRGNSTAIAPYEIEYGVDDITLGTFTFDGDLPPVVNTKSVVGDNGKFLGKLGNRINGMWNLNYIAGSSDNSRSFDDYPFNKDYWNTRLDKYGDDWVGDANCNSDAKFPDGYHDIWVKIKTVCRGEGNEITVTSEIYINNFGPEVEVYTGPRDRRRPSSGANNLYAYFTEPMDPSSFTDNIDIGAICRNMASVNIDSMKFSEDLTELTMFLPDTFPGNEAYHVELSNDITDIAGTPLDGNANCEIDDYDNYENIVGTGYCNHTFIVQTGGYSTLEETYNYTDHWNSECRSPDYYDFYDFDNWGIYEIDHIVRQAEQITVEGAVFHMPWNKNKIQLIVVLSDQNVISDTISSEHIEQVSDTRTNWTYTFPANEQPYGFAVKMTYTNISIGYWPKAKWARIKNARTFAYQKKLSSYGYIALNDCPAYVGYPTMWDCDSFDDYSKQMEQKHYQWAMDIDAQVIFGTGFNMALVSLCGRTSPQPPFYAMNKFVVSEPYIASRYGGFGCPDYYAIDEFHLTAHICGNPTQQPCDIVYKATCDGSAVPVVPTGSYSIICSPGFDFTGVAGEPPSSDVNAEFCIDWGSQYSVAMALGAPESFTITASSGGSARPETSNEGSEPHKEPELPKEFSLGAPRPNPFNTSVSFDIDLPTSATVDLRIYDILGNLVDNPIDHVEIPAGKITEKWTCENCPSGTYFIMLHANDFRETRKMTLIK